MHSTWSTLTCYGLAGCQTSFPCVIMLNEICSRCLSECCNSRELSSRELQPPERVNPSNCLFSHQHACSPLPSVCTRHRKHDTTLACSRSIQKCVQSYMSACDCQLLLFSMFTADVRITCGTENFCFVLQQVQIQTQCSHINTKTFPDCYSNSLHSHTDTYQCNWGRAQTAASTEQPKAMAALYF